MTYESNYLQNLAHLAIKGIILSWSIIGDSRHFHVNNRDNTYIKGELEKYGFACS
jgi:hypothetical protein